MCYEERLRRVLAWREEYLAQDRGEDLASSVWTATRKWCVPGGLSAGDILLMARHRQEWMELHGRQRLRWHGTRVKQGKHKLICTLRNKIINIGILWKLVFFKSYYIVILLLHISHPNLNQIRASSWVSMHNAYWRKKQEFSAALKKTLNVCNSLKKSLLISWILLCRSKHNLFQLIRHICN